MSFLKYSLKTMGRRKFKSLIVLMVSLMLVIFITYYANVIESQIETLNELHANIEVTAFMTSTYGELENLQIREDIIKNIENSGFIEEGFYTRNLWFTTEPWNENDSVGMVNMLMFDRPYLTGASNIEAIPRFSHDKAIMPEFLDGYDESIFASSGNLGIAGSNFMTKNNLELGDEVTLTVAQTLQQYNPDYAGLIKRSTKNLKIVGVYYSEVENPPFYIPWESMEELYNELELPLIWSSARYTLKNTQELDEFKELIQRNRFNHPGQREGVNSAMPVFVIQDQILNDATSSVSNHIDFMTLLYPFIYFLCAGIGFLVSYLLIRIRKPEFAIMRSIGTGRVKTFFSFFFEQSILSLVGGVIGMILSFMVAKSLSSIQVYSIIGYILSYWVGATIAIMMVNSGNVFQILSAKE